MHIDSKIPSRYNKPDLHAKETPMPAEIMPKSVEYLLKHAGPVIRYRLKKEILNDISEKEEELLLSEIRLLPHYRLVESYRKTNGYIGSGMHSWDNWRQKTLHETPLQDGENAARLLSYYRIPKNSEIVSGFVSAMRSEKTLEEEFSYIPPEKVRFENRFNGLNNGNCLISILYAMQAMLGFGDDYEDTVAYQAVCLKGFSRILEISSVDDITHHRKNAKMRYHYPYIESDEFLPDIYTLSMLAYTKSWRSRENIAMIADSLNRINRIMKPGTDIHVKIGNRYYAPCFAFVRPLRAFRPDIIDIINYRKILTEIAMTGVGEQADLLKESKENILSAVDENGILRMNFSLPHNKRYSPKKIEYPSAYTDVRLEADYTNKEAVFLDLTFWAVELIHLIENTKKGV